MKRRAFLTTLSALPVTLAGALALRRDAGAAAPMSGAIDEIRNSWRTLVPKGADVATTAEPLVRSNAEWKKILDPKQYVVLREEGTEYPGSSPLNNEKRAGVYVCAGCALPLFTSRMKFDSGTGWPSFFTSIPRPPRDEEGLQDHRRARRVPLRALRRPPGARVRRRPAADEGALVQQRCRAAVHSGLTRSA